MLTKITIEKIFEPKTFGDFTSQSVFTKEFPNVYIGGEASISKDWKVGDVVEVVISEKEKNGKIYKNFSLPKKVDLATDRIAKLESRVMTLELSFERKFAEMKSDLCLELTGKVQTEKDYKEYSKPHPMSIDNPPNPEGISF